MVQWLRLWVPNAGGPDLIPGQGTRFYMPQLKRSCILQRSIQDMHKKNQFTSLQTWKSESVMCDMTKFKGEVEGINSPAQTDMV